MGAGRGNGRSGVRSLERSFGHLGIFLGEVTEKLYNSKRKENPGTPLPISVRWLECVNEELTALAVYFTLSVGPKGVFLFTVSGTVHHGALVRHQYAQPNCVVIQQLVRTDFKVTFASF